MMNHKNMVVLFVAVLFLVGACQSGLAYHPRRSTHFRSTKCSIQLETATQPVFPGRAVRTATKPPLTGGNGQKWVQA